MQCDPLPATATMKLLFGLPERTGNHKPYPWWCHPEKRWSDVFVSRFLDSHYKFGRLTKYSPSSEAAAKEVVNLRARVMKDMTKGFKHLIQKWQQLAQSPIAEIVYDALPRPDLVQEILGHASDEYIPKGSRVRFFLPLSSLSRYSGTGERTAVDTQLVQIEHLSDLPTDAPIIIFFHGGGFVSGDPYEPFSIIYVVEALRLLPNPVPVIIGSVELGLFPETFPGPTLEAVAAVDGILEALPLRVVHLHGSCTGAHFALATAMECFRRHPGRIGSVLLQSPMIDPSCQSSSFQLNGPSSWIPGSFIKWAWRAYLGFRAYLQSSSTACRINGTDQFLGRHQRTQQRKTDLLFERLVLVSHVLPSGLNRSYGPQFIIVTNRGDPLHDDGEALVDRLVDQSAKVKYLDHPGSHVIGSHIDSRAHQELVATYRDLLLLRC